MTDNQQTQEVNPQELDDFKNNVKNYLNLDDDIKKLEKNVRERKQLKKKLTDQILIFMNQYNIEDLNTEAGKLKKSISYTKKPLNKTTLKTRLLQYFDNNSNKTDLAIKFIDNREKEEHIRLKRINKKTDN